MPTPHPHRFSCPQLLLPQLSWQCPRCPSTERSFHRNHRFSQQHPSLPDSWPLFTSLLITALSSCFPDVRSWVIVVYLTTDRELSKNAVVWGLWDHSRPLMQSTGGGPSHLAAFWSLTSVALLTTLQLKSFSTTHGFSLLSHHKSKAGLGWGRDTGVTHHVKAKDCKMQKMSARAFLCH